MVTYFPYNILRTDYENKRAHSIYKAPPTQVSWEMQGHYMAHKAWLPSRDKQGSAKARADLEVSPSSLGLGISIVIILFTFKYV